jgi:hypothetical protein
VERVAIAEQIILSLAFDQYQKRDPHAKILDKIIKNDNSEAKTQDQNTNAFSHLIMQAKPQKVGYYSFDWINFQSRSLLDKLRKQSLDAETQQELEHLNAWLPKQFWGLGHLQAAVNQLVVLNLLFMDNENNRNYEEIVRYQANALFNLRCARKFLYSPIHEVEDEESEAERELEKSGKLVSYSKQILQMTIPNGDIKRLLVDSGLDNELPADMSDDKLLELLETQMVETLKVKGVAIENTEMDADIENYFKRSRNVVLDSIDRLVDSFAKMGKSIFNQPEQKAPSKQVENIQQENRPE